MTNGQPYTSGNWITKAGQEQAFVDEWTAFTRWSLDAAAGAREFTLIQDTSDPRHFISFGVWDRGEAVKEWRSGPEFAQRMGRCRALCDDFVAADYVLAALVAPERVASD